MKAWVLPEYGIKSIVEIPHFILEFFGAERHPLLKNHSDSTTFEDLKIDKEKKDLVFILIDGLGYKLFKKLAEDSVIPFLSSFNSTYLTSTFPSTTATALVSLSSGYIPSDHGILGFKMFLERPYTTMNTIFYAIEGLDSVKVPFEEESFMAAFYVYEALARKGVKVYPFLKKEFIDTSFSKIVYGFIKNVPYVHDVDLIVRASEILKRSNMRKFVSLYTPTLDSLSHTYGPYSEEVAAFMHFFDGLLERYLSPLLRDVLLVITADHGHIETTPQNAIMLCDKENIYRRIIGYPAGEPRAMYLNVRNKKEFIRDVREEFGDKLEIKLRSEVEHEGLWGGKLKDEFKVRVGDVVLIPNENYYIICKEENESVLKMRGRHGGLSLEEMLVPFIYN